MKIINVKQRLDISLGDAAPGEYQGLAWKHWIVFHSNGYEYLITTDRNFKSTEALISIGDDVTITVDGETFKYSLFCPKED